MTPRERWFLSTCKHLNVTIDRLGAICTKCGTKVAEWQTARTSS